MRVDKRGRNDFALEVEIQNWVMEERLLKKTQGGAILSALIFYHKEEGYFGNPEIRNY